MENIATTRKIENRLNELRGEIKSKSFNPDTIDIVKDFYTFQQDKKIYRDGIKGYSRLIDDDSFFQMQVRGYNKTLNKSDFKNHRLIIIMPDKFRDYNKLRTTILDIQDQAGANKFFMPVAKNETFDKIKDFVSSLKYDKPIILVVDMSMEYEELYLLLNWAIKKDEEIVLIYKDWIENKTNFSLVIRLAEKFPNKLHMALVPCSISRKGIVSMVSTLLITKGFKSISLDDPIIPNYIFGFIRNRKPKTELQKMEDGVWVNEETMNYERKHKEDCKCINGSNMKGLIKKYGTKECITHHNLEVLSKRYKDIKNKEDVKNEVLGLESMKYISKLIQV